MSTQSSKQPWHQQLRWKLTFGYGLVAFVALVAAEVLFILLLGAYLYFSQPDFNMTEFVLHSFRAAMQDNVIVLPLILLLSHGRSSRFSKRIQLLTDATDEWGQGHFSVQPCDASKDEIGALSRHLLRMVDHLQSLMRTNEELSASEERNRIARDLHDTVKQQVFATQMELNAARLSLDADPTSTGAIIDRAIDLTSQSQRDLRDVILRLRPVGLEHDTLAVVLSRYISSNCPKDMAIEMKVRGDRDLPLDVEEAFFRVAQAALSNVINHANADAVGVDLEIEEDTVRLSVEDNGKGFDKEDIDPSAFGLIAMGQRMEQIGGTARFESTPGHGTIITAEAPVPAEEQSSV